SLLLSSSKRRPSSMEDGSETNPFVLDDDAQERLALLHQMYQQKQESLLRGATAAAPLNVAPVAAAAVPQFPLNLQNLQQIQQYLVALQQQQQETMDTGSTCSLTGAGLGGNSSGGSMPQTPTTSVASTGSSVSSTHAAAAAAAMAATPPQHRNRKLTMETRSLSGSSQTISQTTKDRLKMMIISKRAGGGSTDSSDGGPPSANLMGPASGFLPPSSVAGFSGQMAGGGPMGGPHRRTGTSRTPPGHVGSHVTAASPHFEPYPMPGGHQREQTALPQPGDYALRKVNSEPNMKMKIRARILSKGNSPVHSVNSAFNFHQGNLQRQDSDCSTSSGLAPPTIIFPPSMMMMPSPSLPNLAAAAAAGSLLQQQQADMANLLAQAAGGTNLTSFLSLPSLFKQQMGLGGSNSSIVDVEQQQQLLLDANKMQLDPRIAALGTANLPGYPSLLKQQLRELVLRRKSLVREEPEDDPTAALAAAAAAVAARTNSAAPGSAFSATGSSPSSSSAGAASIDYLALAAQLLQQYNSNCEAAAAAAAALAAGPSSSTAGETQRVDNSDLVSVTGLVYDSSMARHSCNCDNATAHVEHGGRTQSVWARLEQMGLTQRCHRLESRLASMEELKLVHSPAFVHFFGVTPGSGEKREAMPVKSFVQLGCGGIGVDSDTYFNETTTAVAARAATGCLIDLCTAVWEGKVRNGFACIRPPGHHAEKEVAMGFCFFNNVAVTVKALRSRYPDTCRKIAIVDWDVHHGNGTQPIFDEDPNVLYLSMHRHDNGNFFPGTGAVTDAGKGEAKGYSLNVAFSGGVMGDAEYLAAWRVVVLPVLQSFRPDFIIVSAGFDASRGHANALGGYEVSPQMFGFMTRSLMGLAGGKVVLAMEGGYNLEMIAESAEECVRALIAPGESMDVCRLSQSALEAMPSLPAQETIQKVIACQKLYWPVLAGGIQPIGISEQHWQLIHAQFKAMTMHEGSSGEAMSS
ncbi:hypothetical protein PENTCL1PPCAC_26348, partial [Pristionchus entomophagus]